MRTPTSYAMYRRVNADHVHHFGFPYASGFQPRLSEIIITLTVAIRIWSCASWSLLNSLVQASFQILTQVSSGSDSGYNSFQVAHITLLAELVD